MEHNPSDFCELLACGTVTVSTGEVADFDANVAWNEYRHVLAIITFHGAGDTAIVANFMEHTVSTSGQTDVVGGPTVSLAADDDNQTAMMELRLHGRMGFGNIKLTGTGGSGSTINVYLIGFGPYRDSIVPAFPTLATAKAYSAMTAA